MFCCIHSTQLFHGVRISDAHTAALTLRGRVLRPNQTFAGVGYSIGAIVLNHYVAAYKEQVALDVSVAISGALYCPPQEHYTRSKETWQVPVAAHTKEMLLIPKWGARLLHQLGSENYHRLRHTSSVVVSRPTIMTEVVVVVVQVDRTYTSVACF